MTSTPAHPRRRLLREIRVFVASSEEHTAAERAAVSDTIERMNPLWAKELGWTFSCYFSERRVAAAPLPPQKQIDPELNRAEVVIGIGNRPLGPFTSHELDWALRRYAADRAPWVMIYFSAAELQQRFRAEQPEATTKLYASIDELSAHIRDDVNRYLIRRKHGAESPLRAMIAATLEPLAEDANEHFEAGRFGAAERAYRDLLRRAEQLLDTAPEAADAAALVAKHRLNIGACLACQGQREEAVAQLRLVDQEALDAVARATLARGLAELGRLDDARRVLADDAGPAANAARQHLAILAGELPEGDDLEDDAWLRTTAALEYTRRGELDRAFELAIAVARHRRADVSHRAAVLDVLAYCAIVTVGRSEPAARPVPPGTARRELVDTVEGLAAELDLARLEPPLRGRVAQALARWAAASFDSMLMEHAHTALQALAKVTPEWAPPLETLEATVRLALADRPDEAVELASASEHPWVPRLLAARNLEEKNPEEGLQRLRALDRELPGRTPIDLALAETLLSRGRADEALGYARRAFEALPAYGQRKVYGKALLVSDPSAEAAERAWAALEPLRRRDEADALVLCAVAAFRCGHQAEAIGLQRRAVARRPTDAPARLDLARLLVLHGEYDAGAAEAWRAFEGDSAGALSIDDLDLVAAVQLRAPGLEQVRGQRVDRVAQVLSERFPDDDATERIRMRLLVALDSPVGHEPIDWDALAASGHVRRFSLDQAAALSNQHLLLVAQAWQLYRHGLRAFGDLVEDVGLTASELIGRVSAGNVLLSTPVHIRKAKPVLPDEGVVLVSDLELLLLQDLDLLRPLDAWLKGDRRVGVFRTDYERIRAASFQPLAEQSKLATGRLRATVELLGRESVRFDSRSAERADLDLARDARVPVCHHEPPGPGLAWVPPSALARWLVEELGVVDADEAAALLALVGSAGVGEQTAVPDRVMLTWVTLDALSRTNLLSRVLDGLSGVDAVWIGPETADTLHAALSRHKRVQADAARARAIDDWLTAAHRDGKVDVIDPPAVPLGLRPPDRANRHPVCDQVLEAWTYWEFLCASPSHWLLTADFFIGAWFPFTDLLGLLPQLGWTEDRLQGVLSRYKPCAPRALHLPELVAAFEDSGLITAETTATAHQSLAGYGFTEALTPALLLAWAGRHSDLTRPRSVRDAFEAAELMAGERGHLGHGSARLSLAAGYAKALWTAWCGPECLPRVSAESLLTTLTGRLEALDARTAAGALDTMMRLLVGLAVDDLDAATRPGADPGTRLATSDSEAGELWQHMAVWASGHPRRAAALSAALRDGLLKLDEQHEPLGPSPRWLAPLRVAIAACHVPVEPVSLLDDAIAALAILSAVWRHGGLEGSSMEVRLSSAAAPLVLDFEASIQWVADRAAELGEAVPIDPATLAARYSQPLPALAPEAHVPMAVPYEAVLLRLPARQAPAACLGLAALVGAEDGHLARALRVLADEPSDGAARRAVARAAVLSPARAVRRDPSRLLGWTMRSSGSRAAPTTLDELRQLLSEPQRLEPGDIDSLLVPRASEPDGAWHGRPEARRLLDRASAVPLLRSNLFRVKLDAAPDGASASEDPCVRAVAVLERTSDHTAADVAAAIVRLRVRAHERPTLGLPDRPVDLRELLPDLLAQALRDVATAPPRDSVAAAEPSMLRACASTVDGLAVSRRERLWLTHRLYGWLVAQLQAAPSEARARGLGAFLRADPGPDRRADGVPDALDPRWFGRETFDLRLASALDALAFMDVIARDWSETDAAAPASVAGAALADELQRLAERSPSAHERHLRRRPECASVLGATHPIAVPDLALFALMALAPERIARLPVAVRLRWFDALATPNSPESGVLWPLVHDLLTTFGHEAEPERAEVRALVSALPTIRSKDAGGVLHAAMRLRLAKAGGPPLDAPLVHDLVRASEDAVPVLAAEYLEIAGDDDAALDASYAQLTTAAADAGTTPAGLLSALGRLVVLADDAATKRWAARRLANLAASPEWKDDEQVQALIDGLGIREAT